MDHLQIWIQIVTLIIGAGVLIDLAQFHRRHQYQFLKPLWWCLLFLNLSFFMALMSRYLFVNFFENIIIFKSSLFMEVSDPISTVFYVGLVYYLMSMSHSIQNKILPRKYGWIFVLMAAAVVLRTVIGVYFSHPELIFQIANVIHIAVMLFCFALNVLILGRFAIGKISAPEDETIKAVKGIGLFYLSGCMLLFLSSAFSGYYHGIVSGLIYMSFNIFPILWYRQNWATANNNLELAISGKGWDGLCEKYGISSRQREIIEFILKGKSNKEIADALFIAPHTVKNHIYSLYQKLGVKSRMELVNFLLSHSKNEKAES